jgi:SAM-dependent methyltransferase
MKGLTLSTYGESIADMYDDLHAINPDAAVALLAELAGEGPVLELGVGTGRLALPLAACGLEVHGIDASEAMVAKLRAKPGAERVKVTMGDFSSVRAGEDFTLAFVAFNTFFALSTLSEQRACFTSVGSQLRQGGKFVLEVFFPDVARFPQGQALRTGRIEVDRVVLEATRHDRLMQTLDAQLVVIRNGDIRLVPMKLRYAWPSELDLMAELAGMRLVHRWASYTKAPFTDTSPQHVSVYEKL